jgi:hypothetical protein
MQAFRIGDLQIRRVSATLSGQWRLTPALLLAIEPWFADNCRLQNVYLPANNSKWSDRPVFHSAWTCAGLTACALQKVVAFTSKELVLELRTRRSACWTVELICNSVVNSRRSVAAQRSFSATTLPSHCMGEGCHEAGTSTNQLFVGESLALP